MEWLPGTHWIFSLMTSFPFEKHCRSLSQMAGVVTQQPTYRISRQPSSYRRNRALPVSATVGIAPNSFPFSVGIHLLVNSATAALGSELVTPVTSMNCRRKIGTAHILSETFFHPFDSPAPFDVKETSTAQALNLHPRTTRVIHPAFSYSRKSGNPPPSMPNALTDDLVSHFGDLGGSRAVFDHLLCVVFLLDELGSLRTTQLL